jgi:two-component system sensor histidine kinase CreC
VRLRTRLFLVIFLITGTGLYFLMDWMLTDLRKRYLEAVEETLVDTSNLLASILEHSGDGDSALVPKTIGDGFCSAQARSFEAKIYSLTKTKVDLRVYVTDARGIVVFDSRPGGGDVGMDYSKWRDVALTLEGKYGARTTRKVATDPLTSTLHVAAPVVRDGTLRGVVVVAKPSSSINVFMALARPKIVVAGVLSGVGVVLAGWLLSIWLTIPIQRLSGYARAVGQGERVPLPPLGASEVRDLGNAFEEMRVALEGRRYVEEYVHALTHELKSPLTAVKAAAEILEDDPPPEVRAKFVANIQRESERLRELVDRLLGLASLESRRTLENPATHDLAVLCAQVRQDLFEAAASRKVSIELAVPAGILVEGDALLLRQAIGNLVLNAVEFAPSGTMVELVARVEAKRVVVEVSDRGPGVPDWALEKVWDRFWSTPRPGGSVKSSGLGLPFVREVARLHGGQAGISPREGGGLVARLVLPGRRQDS